MYIYVYTHYTYYMYRYVYYKERKKVIRKKLYDKVDNT